MPTLLVATGRAAAAVYPLVRGLQEVQRRGWQVEMLAAPEHVAPLAGAGLNAQYLAPSEIGPLLERSQPDAILADLSAADAVAPVGRAAVPWAALDASGSADAVSHWRSAMLTATNPSRFLLMPVDPAVTPPAAGMLTAAEVRVTGAAPWDPERAVPAWLDADGDPWILVACSGAGADAVALARYGVAAFRDEPYRVVVTIPHAFDAAHLIPSTNVRVERFWPHRALVDRAAVVICEGTDGVTTKAMRAGAPLVIVPPGQDEAARAERLAAAGDAMVLPARRLRAKRLRRVVAEALAAQDGERCGSRRHGSADANGDSESARAATAFADCVNSLLQSETDGLG